MKRVIAVLMLGMFTAGCAHQAVINSNPPGAKVYIDGEFIGKTPTTFEDRSGAGKEYQIKLEKEGYNLVVSKILQDNWNTGCVVFSAVGGVLVALPLLGLIWSRQLRDNYIYELEKAPPEK